MYVGRWGCVGSGGCGCRRVCGCVGGGDVCEGVEDVGVFVFVVLVLVGEGCGILGCVWVWRVWGV